MPTDTAVAALLSGPPDASCEAADDRLAVKPKAACRMLDVGTTRLYELLNADPPELESYSDGRSRKITTASIRAYVRRRLEAARAEAAKAVEPVGGQPNSRKRADAEQVV